jgi:hypothetical protein
MGAKRCLLRDLGQTLMITAAAVQVLLRCVKLIGVADVVSAICNNELAGDFGKGETGAMMRMVERFAKEHGGAGGQ